MNHDRRPVTRRSAVRRSFAVVALCLGTTAALAADPYPNKPIRIAVPAAADGGLDLIARLVAEKMAEKLGKQVLVENRAGADTLVGARFAKDQPADGYTVLAQANCFTLLPEMRADAGYDALKDFTRIGFLSRVPFIMEVPVSEPSNSIKEFVARAWKDKLSFASGGIGGPPHMAAVMFLRAQGIEMTAVTYKGNGAALPNVASGRVDLIFDTYISSAAFPQAGRLKPLAVTSTAWIAPRPKVPTIIESGIDYKYPLWLGLIVRSGTPRDVILKLSDARRRALDNKALKERFISEGTDTTWVSPEEFNDPVARESLEMKKLVRELNLRQSRYLTARPS
jgi:tripartite-type tricarboxylate transporter receptor subunit TctC